MRKKCLFPIISVLLILFTTYGKAGATREAFAQAQKLPISSLQSPGTENDVLDFEWIYNQPTSSNYTTAIASQELPDFPIYSTYLADDFYVDGGWLIDEIFVPGGGWSGFTTLMNATSLNWKIYADDDGFPAGYPSDESTCVWSFSVAPSYSGVTIYDSVGGEQASTLLELPSPLQLTTGRYWFVYYPVLNLNPDGRFGLMPSESMNGHMVKAINPNGGHGHGTEWQDWSEFGGITRDFAFSFGGEVMEKTFLPLIIN